MIEYLLLYPCLVDISNRHKKKAAGIRYIDSFAVTPPPPDQSIGSLQHLSIRCRRMYIYRTQIHQ